MRHSYLRLLAPLLATFLYALPAAAESEPPLFAPYLSLGASAGLGKALSENETTVASRTMAVYRGEGILGLRAFRYLIAGGNFGYSQWNQVTDPKDVKNQNLQGSALDYGLVAGFSLGRCVLLAKLPLKADYKLEKKNSLAETEKYTSATGYAVELRFRGQSGFFGGLEYLRHKYEKFVTGNFPETTFTPAGTERVLKRVSFTLGWEY